jgi:hypothetical protein
VGGQGSPNKGSAGEMTSPGKGADENHTGPGQLVMDASSDDSSSDAGTDADAGAEASAEAGGPFACGSVMCIPPMQYCSVNKTNFGSNTSYQCMSTPFNCDAGPTCGCVTPFQPFEGGAAGCTCADNSGAVTLTCPY